MCNNISNVIAKEEKGIMKLKRDDFMAQRSFIRLCVALLCTQWAFFVLISFCMHVHQKPSRKTFQHNRLWTTSLSGSKAIFERLRITLNTKFIRQNLGRAVCSKRDHKPQPAPESKRNTLNVCAARTMCHAAVSLPSQAQGDFTARAELGRMGSWGV